MNWLKVLTTLMAIVALPSGVFGKPERKPIKIENKQTSGKQEKHAPAPPALILLGVAPASRSW